MLLMTSQLLIKKITEQKMSLFSSIIVEHLQWNSFLQNKVSDLDPLVV